VKRQAHAVQKASAMLHRNERDRGAHFAIKAARDWICVGSRRNLLIGMISESCTLTPSSINASSASVSRSGPTLIDDD
jgi:hypothetical protein